MKYLELQAVNDSYSVNKSADEYVRVQLDGGAGRYSIDLFGVSDLVALSFVCSPSEFNYLKSFHTDSVKTGDAFLMGLLIDSFEPQLYECRFMPSTFQITGTKGLNVYVSVTVEALPSEDSDIKTLMDEFGYDWYTQFPIYEDRLHKIVNILLPQDFN